MICFTSGIRKSSTRALAGLSGASHAVLRLKAEGSCSPDRRSCITRSAENLVIASALMMVDSGQITDNQGDAYE